MFAKTEECHSFGTPPPRKLTRLNTESISFDFYRNTFSGRVVPRLNHAVVQMKEATTCEEIRPEVCRRWKASFGGVH